MSSISKIGIVTGLLASAYLGFLAVIGDHGGSALKYGKYIILIIGLIIFYQRRMRNWTYEDFIAKYIGASAKIAIVAGLIIAATNTLLFVIEPEFSIQKYSLLAENMTQLLTIDAIIIIETLVLGLLSSFVIFPYFKNKFLDNKGIQQSQEQVA